MNANLDQKVVCFVGSADQQLGRTRRVVERSAAVALSRASRESGLPIPEPETPALAQLGYLRLASAGPRLVGRAGKSLSGRLQGT